MKTYLDCISCFFNQALRAGRMANADDRTIKLLLDEVGMMLKDVSLQSSPPQIGMKVYEKVMEITGVVDPYRKVKDESTRKALELRPSLKRRIKESNDGLLTAIRVAVAGNVMDFGVNRQFIIEKDIEEILEKDFAILDYDQFRRCLKNTDEVLYIGDNAGEAVFDSLLIEELGKRVTYVVRGAPVINDVTYEDAVQAGIEKVATIISSGTHAPGTILNTCSADFNKIYRNAKMVMSKGQGNYEGLSGEKRPQFFLLKAKCHVIAEDIGVKEGDIVCKRGGE